jgi:hypothetical protein
MSKETCLACMEIHGIQCINRGEIARVMERVDANGTASAALLNALPDEVAVDDCHPSDEVFNALANVINSKVWWFQGTLVTYVESTVQRLCIRYVGLQSFPRLILHLTSHCESLVQAWLASPGKFAPSMFRRIELALEGEALRLLRMEVIATTPIHPVEFHAGLAPIYSCMKEKCAPFELSIMDDLENLYLPLARNSVQSKAFKLDLQIARSIHVGQSRFYDHLTWSTAIGEFDLPLGLRLPDQEFSNATTRATQLVSRFGLGVGFLVTHPDPSVAIPTLEKIEQVVRARYWISYQVNEYKDYIRNFCDFSDLNALSCLFGFLPFTDIYGSG